MNPTIKLSTVFQPTVLLAIALMAVIVMMILPMPSWVLDVGLAASFAIAILIFTVTLFISRPLDFSSFPTILLASLMLRLSLNVSSTKLIIGNGHTGTDAAGGVIQGFANFIMGGSVALGLVVFGVLIIVNFIVITKGAGRMAEVSARFALDAMPGKQLAIDSDVAAGAIGHDEAKERRRIEQEETTFFGSLDGASKFVKGDAIAGLLITLLNLVMGLAIGIILHDMPVGQAFETYSILTVGDGLVSQIPAVIISIAAALLLSKGGATGAADVALFDQLGKYPVALGTVATLLALFALVPGLPFLPFIAGASILGFAAFTASKGHLRREQESQEEANIIPPKPEKTLGDLLDLDDIHLEFAPNLVPTVLDEATGLDTRILNMRNHIASVFGFIIPEIRMTDNIGLPDDTYVIRVQGVEVARNVIDPNRVLVLIAEDDTSVPAGRNVAEPVYGAPARWIERKYQEDAAVQGLAVVAPTEVVATHVLEVIKQNFGKIFSRRALRKLLDEFVTVSEPKRAEANRRLLDEFVPDKLPVEMLHSVMRLLLEERVSIRNLPLILEAAAEANGVLSNVDAVTEHVRKRLGFQLVSDLQEPDGALPLVQLKPAWEELFNEYQIQADNGVTDVALPPDEFNRLAKSVAERLANAAKEGRFPALITSAKRRRFLQTVLRAKGIRNPVLSFDEIGPDAQPALLGTA